MTLQDRECVQPIRGTRASIATHLLPSSWGLGEGVIIKSDLLKIQNPLVICKKSYCMEKLLDPGPILYNSLRSVLLIFLTSHPKKEGKLTGRRRGPSHSN